MTQEERRLYWVWAEMLSRCRNPRHRQWKDYGGRGVTVCERWLTFAAFREDMGARPPGLSLDRIDNSLGYGPHNCQWATRATQNSNRRNCIYVEVDGERLTLREVCRRRELPYRAVVKRVQDRGWPLSVAISAPIGARLRRIAA